MKKKKKNSNYKADFTNQGLSVNKTQKKKDMSFVIFISVFLSVVLTVGLIFAISFGVKNSRAVVKYEGTTLNREEASFFASYYKKIYMANLSQSGIEATDTEEFWQSKANAINTYAEILEYNTREYMKQVIVANYVYDSNVKLSSEEKRNIKLAVEEVLEQQANGNEDSFNNETEKFGFSYDDFYDISVKLYKASFVRKALFGDNGAGIASETKLCADYLNEYSHVKLMFIRTDRDFKLDANGDRVQVDGSDVLFELSAEEKAARAADIAEIRAAIEGFNNGGNLQMSPIMFDTFLAKYKSGYDDMDKDGFYFHSSSEYTKEFSEAFPEIVDKALEMEAGKYAEIPFKDGICFIYKYDVEEGAYTENGKGTCFEDFYKNASAKALDTMITELMKDVEITDKIEELDFTSIPYNTTHYPKF